ncbi:MAG: hypothetical protein AB8I08_00655 [Sandaracinaceae bacterium]
MGCGESHDNDGGLPQDGDLPWADATPGLDSGPAPDGGPRPDAGPTPDSGPRPDSGPTPDGGPADGGPSDAGPPDAGPPEPCDTPGALETVSCGNCGMVERFCAAGGTWSYGVCSDEGVCEPGTLTDLACGNCGSEAARCTAACEWEVTSECTGEGECAPGTRSRSSDGCGSGETRDVLCGDTCVYAPDGVCEADGCSTPGALETVSCGDRCGSQERFCASSGIWEYAVCGDEGVCAAGGTETVDCGMCGTRVRRCVTGCTWDDSAACMGEGICEPGSVQRDATGCPAGEARLLTCTDACTFSAGACEEISGIDVMLLFDMTGSQAGRLETNLTSIEDNLVAPLLALGDVSIGVAAYADFPEGAFGGFSDEPFHGVSEPVSTASEVEVALAALPSFSGGDGPESGVEALSVLAGGTPPDSATPLTCSSGRSDGGCWASGVTRIVIVYTDALNHNGPSTTSSGLFDPYPMGMGAAEWPDVQAALTSDGTFVLFLLEGSAAAEQVDQMLMDLGQPGSDRFNASGDFEGALGAIVARVSALRGM